MSRTVSARSEHSILNCAVVFTGSRTLAVSWQPWNAPFLSATGGCIGRRRIQDHIHKNVVGRVMQGEQFKISMMTLRKIVAWGVVVFACLVVVFFALPMYRQGEPTVAGKRAEDFPMGISGKPGHLSDLKGKVVVLNFWATYCAPCVQEMPSLNKLQKYIESRNAMVLGVSVDEDPNAYQRFIKDS